MKLTINKIKGISGAWELSPRTLLTGPMGSGKSAIIAGLHLALTGTMQELRGVDPGELRKAVSNGGYAELTIEGQSVRRTVNYTEKKARVLTQVFVDGAELSQSETTAAIKAMEAKAPDLMHLDFATFKRMNPRERKEALLEYFPGLDGPDCLKWVQAEVYYSLSQSEDKPKHGVRDVTAYRKEAIDNWGEARLEQLTETLHDTDMSLADKLKAIHHLKKSKAQDAKAAKAAVDGVDEITPDVKKLAESLPGKREKLAILQSTVSELEQRRDRASRVESRRQALLDEIDAIETELVNGQKRKERPPRPDDEATEREYERLLGDLRRTKELSRQQSIIYHESREGTCPLDGDSCNRATDIVDERAALALAEGRRLKELHDRQVAESEEIDSLLEQWRTYNEWETATKRLDDLLDKMQQKEEEIETLDADPVDADKLTDAKADRAAAQAAVDEAANAKAQIDVVTGIGLDEKTAIAQIWSKAHTGAKQGRYAYIDKRLSSFKKTVTKGIKSVGLGDKFALDLSGRELQIGLNRGDQYVDLDVLSGGETGLFAGVVLSALPDIEKSTTVTVEVAETPPAAIKRLQALLTESDLETVVLATWATPEPVDGWTIIDMEA